MRSTSWRSFRTAAWLGWQIESNWTQPLLFALYSILKPLAVAGILVVLYALVTGGNFTSPIFAYMYLGNAFYTYVGAVMTGMANAAAEDRERYQTLRSIYVAPVDIRSYLVGRGVARFVTATVSVAITIALGILFLHLQIRFWTIKWPMLLIALVGGLVMLSFMGLILSGIALLLPDNSWSIGDGVAGALYLLSGAIVPIDVLPRVLRPLGFGLPITYWLELLRRSLVGNAPGASTFPGWTDLDLLAAFIGLTAALTIIALMIFRSCDFWARERGLIDRTTGH